MVFVKPSTRRLRARPGSPTRVSAPAARRSGSRWSRFDPLPRPPRPPQSRGRGAPAAALSRMRSRGGSFAHAHSRAERLGPGDLTPPPHRGTSGYCGDGWGGRPRRRERGRGARSAVSGLFVSFLPPPPRGGPAHPAARYWLRGVTWVLSAGTAPPGAGLLEDGPAALAALAWGSPGLLWPAHPSFAPFQLVY